MITARKSPARRAGLKLSSVRANPADVLMVLGFGVLGYVMRVADLPAAPLLLGFVLGPLVETQFRRSMVLARGDFTAILERPLAGTVLALAALMLVWTLVGTVLRRRRHMAALRNPATDDE